MFLSLTLSNRCYFVSSTEQYIYLKLLIAVAYLRLNSVDVKQHPVFRELTRVRQYFEKIKKAENPGTRRENMGLDKPAARRIIRHALVGSTSLQDANPTLF